MLYQAVDEVGFEKIASVSTSKEAWDILAKVYKGADKVKQVHLQTLRSELESIKMKESEGVSDYITCVQIMVNQFNRKGEALTDAQVEGVAVEVEEIVTVVEVAVKKGIMRRKSTHTSKIGLEDILVGEAVRRIIPTSSATSVADMVIMRRIITSISIIIVARWGIFQKSVESRKRWRKQPI
ncbi:hypothetical protein VNO78_34409 [Psophocarpus tetragonolobus]|uniref:Uncharacterized protein n=1 Tax=Psophocarpus tetragonolobus TaxID=3891 RepID=A0AAN9P063_PSOTE